MRLGDYTAISSSLRYFSLGEVDAGENMSIKPYEMAFDIGVSRMLSENFSAAIALRYIRSDLSGNYSDDTKPGNAFAADVAMYYNKYVVMGSRECQLGLGLNISNIGSKMKFGDENTYFIPTNLRLGVNYLIPINEYNKIAFGLDLNKLLVPTMPRQKDDESGEDYQQRLQKTTSTCRPLPVFSKVSAMPPADSAKNLKKFSGVSAWNILIMTNSSYVQAITTKTKTKVTVNISQ